jgi:uncharacterized protein
MLEALKPLAQDRNVAVVLAGLKSWPSASAPMASRCRTGRPMTWPASAWAPPRSSAPTAARAGISPWRWPRRGRLCGVRATRPRAGWSSSRWWGELFEVPCVALDPVEPERRASLPGSAPTSCARPRPCGPRPTWHGTSFPNAARDLSEARDEAVAAALGVWLALAAPGVHAAEPGGGKALYDQGDHAGALEIAKPLAKPATRPCMALEAIMLIEGSRRRGDVRRGERGSGRHRRSRPAGVDGEGRRRRTRRGAARPRPALCRRGGRRARLGKAAEWFRSRRRAGLCRGRIPPRRLVCRGQGGAATWWRRANGSSAPPSRAMATQCWTMASWCFAARACRRTRRIGAQWLMVAARQGNPVAQNRLAKLYAVGRGVEAEPVEAAKWHMLATEAGRRDAELDTFSQGATSSAGGPRTRRPLHRRGADKQAANGNQPAQ